MIITCLTRLILATSLHTSTLAGGVSTVSFSFSLFVVSITSVTSVVVDSGTSEESSKSVSFTTI